MLTFTAFKSGGSPIYRHGVICQHKMLCFIVLAVLSSYTSNNFTKTCPSRQENRFSPFFHTFSPSQLTSDIVIADLRRAGPFGPQLAKHNSAVFTQFSQKMERFFNPQKTTIQPTKYQSNLAQQSQFDRIGPSDHFKILACQLTSTSTTC